MAHAEDVAQRLVEAGLIAPEHLKTLADTLTDFAADTIYHWEEHEWNAEPVGVRFGPEEDDILLASDARQVYRLIAAHEATRRRLLIVQSQLEQIRDLTDYDA